jgi:hypothetical protein
VPGSDAGITWPGARRIFEDWLACNIIAARTLKAARPDGGYEGKLFVSKDLGSAPNSRKSPSSPRATRMCTR